MKPHVPVVLVSPYVSTPSGEISAADAVLLKSDAPVLLAQVLDHLLKVRFPFFTRWLGNWKHRVGA
jgi:hypothetical protein